MTTVEDILRTRFNYSPSDFGEGARVSVDSGTGTISPVGKASDCARKEVPIAEIIKPGVHVRLGATTGQEKLFSVLTTNKDGVTVLFKNGNVGFLPWFILSYPLSSPSTVEINDYDSGVTDNFDRELTQTELNHLLKDVREHKEVIIGLLARIELLTIKLQEPSLGRPSSW
jgi:hypothetical protein